MKAAMTALTRSKFPNNNPKLRPIRSGGFIATMFGVTRQRDPEWFAGLPRS
jgi:hypothetical protein